MRGLVSFPAAASAREKSNWWVCPGVARAVSVCCCSAVGFVSVCVCVCVPCGLRAAPGQVMLVPI